LYSTNLSPAAAQVVIGAMKIMTGEDGSDLGQQKLKALKENSNFFRQGLIERGFQVFGENDSPVIPVMIYFPCKLMAFSRACLARGVYLIILLDYILILHVSYSLFVPLLFYPLNIDFL
jgi:serine palmitoyltransferase